MSIRSLIIRWDSSVENRTAYNDTLKVFRRGGRLTQRHSPFELIDKYIDFRGFHIDEYMMVKNVTSCDLDLSHCSLSSLWIENCTFENVNFRNADLRGISDLGNTFKNCFFTGTKFQTACLGYKGSSYRNCTFDAAKFNRAVFTRAEFDECSFINCKLKGVDFKASSFVDCAFVGKLDDVWFRGGFPLESLITEFGQPRRNRMMNVSFQDAILHDITFSDCCDLSTIVVPREGNYRHYSSWKKRLEKLVHTIPLWPENERSEATIFFSSYIRHADHQDWYLLNVEDIEQEFSKVLAAKIIDVLDSAV